MWNMMYAKRLFGFNSNNNSEIKRKKLVRNTKLEKRKKKNELNRPPTDDNENYLLFSVFEKYFRFFFSRSRVTLRSRASDNEFL